MLCVDYSLQDNSFYRRRMWNFFNNDIKALMLIPAEITCIRLDHNFTIIMIKLLCINSMAAKVLPESLPVCCQPEI